MWLQVDLLAAFNLQRVVLRSAGGSEVYELFGSLDNTNWTQLTTPFAATAVNPITMDNHAGALRYLRCNVVGGSDWSSLAEIEAYPVVAISSMTVTSGVVLLSLTNCLSVATNTIERSFDLSNPAGWNALTNLTGVSEGVVWQDAMSNAGPRAFYRVKSQ